MKVYDFNNGILNFKSRGCTFDIKLRQPITIISGKSASGKTFLLKSLREFVNDEVQNNGLSIVDANIVFVSDVLDTNRIRGVKEHLIMFDRGDVLLTDELVKYIRQDWDNDYLIFARTPHDFKVSTNYYGDLVYNNDSCTFYIDFRFSVGGWF